MPLSPSCGEKAFILFFLLEYYNDNSYYYFVLFQETNENKCEWRSNS